MMLKLKTKKMKQLLGTNTLSLHQTKNIKGGEYDEVTVTSNKGDSKGKGDEGISFIG
ncbi:hypothetical protein [Pseudoalteromonas phenolica]|uniref:hypothetical protein n=1 Tax=Pseudoalteromonas phenolica TaxID=161398 RepID=UPI0013EE7076|nr:hypothetical protein [Pseudoalteromonas phenolica]